MSAKPVPPSPPSAAEIATLRARRRASEATRLADEAEHAAKLAEHARVLAEHAATLAEVRRHLDEERDERVRQEHARNAASLRVTEIEEQIARLVAERDALRAGDHSSLAREQAARNEEDRAARRREAEEALDAERERFAQRCALAEEMARELTEIEQRLDERGRDSERAIPASRAAALSVGAIPNRRKPRFAVQASVLLDHDGTQAALQLVNLSMTGALISTEGLAISTLRKGSLLFITLFATNDPERQVDVNARVVRQDAQGIAVDWSDEHATSHAVAALLDDLCRST